MIRVVAVVTANPGRREEILSVFRANVANVRAEKGCIEYAAHVDAADIGPFQAKFGPDTLVVLESWESPEALRRSHRNASHEGLRATNQGSDREPGDSRAVGDRLASIGPGPRQAERKLFLAVPASAIPTVGPRNASCFA